jgi:vitamin B12 transporter
LGAELDTARGSLLRIAGGQVTTDRSESDGGVVRSSADAERTFADASLRHSIDDATFTAGLSYERNAISTQPQFASPLSVSEDQYAAYGIGQFSVARHLTVTAAARVDDYQNFGAQTTYSVGLVFDAAPGRVFFSYGEAFKAPSLSERFETSFFNIGNPDLDPETSRSWEIGADWDLIDGFSVGASYYRTRISDLIEYDFLALQNINVGRAQIDGAEAYVELRPIDGAHLRLGYSWTDARNGDTGAQLARRPEHAWLVQAGVAPTESLALIASWNRVGERVDVAYNDAGQFLSATGKAVAFDLLAVAATFNLNAGAQLFARVDNLMDETYEQPLAFAGRPRTLLVGVRARR